MKYNEFLLAITLHDDNQYMLIRSAIKNNTNHTLPCSVIEQVSDVDVLDINYFETPELKGDDELMGNTIKDLYMLWWVGTTLVEVDSIDTNNIGIYFLVSESALKDIKIPYRDFNIEIKNQKGYKLIYVDNVINTLLFNR